MCNTKKLYHEKAKNGQNQAEIPGLKTELGKERKMKKMTYYLIRAGPLKGLIFVTFTIKEGKEGKKWMY